MGGVDRVQAGDRSAGTATPETQQLLYDAAYQDVRARTGNSAGTTTNQSASDAATAGGDEPYLKPLQFYDSNPDGRSGGDNDRPGQNVASETARENLTAADMRRLYEKNLKRLDTDNDGFVSESEIDRAITDRSISGADAQLVAVLKRKREALQDLSNDEFGRERRGVSLNDMKELERLKSEYAMLRYAKEQAAKIDRDGDGNLTIEEIKQFADALPEQEADKKKLLGQLEEAARKESIAVKDLDGYIKNFSTKRALVESIEGELAESGKKLKPEKNTLYGTNNPLDSVRPEAIHQGMAGDCEFLAALAALAKSDPQKIKDMIRSNPDGTYTVTFPGAAAFPVTVERPTDAELALYAAPSEYGIWAAVMEKAYGRFLDAYPQTGSGHDHRNTEGPSFFNAGLILLTGQDVDSVYMAAVGERKMTSADVESTLKRALSEGRPITADIGLNTGPRNEIGIPTMHVYTVLGYDENTGKVKLRNPWGSTEPFTNRDGKDDGIFELTLDEFKQYFIRMNIGRTRNRGPGVGDA